DVVPGPSTLPSTTKQVRAQMALLPYSWGKADGSGLCCLHCCGYVWALLHIPKATSSCLCPCCSARTFCSMSDTSGANLLDCNHSIPDQQLLQRIVSQVEFYLSDENLAKDAFLLKHVQKNKMGFVSIKLLTSFKKVRYLTRDWRLTLYALQFSRLLEVNKEGTKVRRKIPIPESLLTVPPSKLLLAWELQPQEQDMPLLRQKNFLDTITRMFSPFGAIAAIRILRPGRKLPSDVRKYTSRFPELLSKCCAMVEYESLESACRAFEDLSSRSCLGRERIKVVRLWMRDSKKKPGAERKVEELERMGWRVQAAASMLPHSLRDLGLCSSPGSDGARVSPPLLQNKDPSAPTSFDGNLKLSSFSNSITGSLLSSKVFPPLGLDTRSCSGPCCSPERRCGWSPWHSSPVPDGKPCPGSAPPAQGMLSDRLGLRDAVLRLPHGSDGTKSFWSGFGRGESCASP
uniref:HTH La-type RNA-binding domain-containing protein n=1 Tax=Amazona collaria TaxID=241587 RepID=A0A8B9G4T7_9PSIT